MKNKNLLNLSKSLPGKLLLTLALVIGWGSSAWADELTVYKGGENGSTNNSTYIPVYGYNVKNFLTQSEFIIEKDSLTDIAGKEITKLTFYLKTPATGAWTSAVFKVYLEEVSSNTYPSSNTAFIRTTSVPSYTGSLDATGSTMEITLDIPYAYSGKNNLLIATEQTVLSTANYAATFYAGTANYGNYKGAYKSSSSGMGSNLRGIKTSLTYETASVGDISAPTSLTASDITPTSATLSWTKGDDETYWEMSYSTTSNDHNTITSIITENSSTLEGLEPNTTYYISVRAKKGTAYSNWSSETSFTTAGATAVTGVTVSPTATEILAGATTTLTATITPADATDQTVTWTSSNTSVATVSDAGVVTAVAPGEATITVTSNDNGEAQASCTITVTAPVTPTALKTKDLYSNYANLTWTNGSTETTWQIKYGTTSGSLNKESGDISSSKKPYLITSLSSNTTYYASIRSKLGTAYSEWSEEFSFTTPAVGPACGGATETTESFDSDWGTTSSLTIKSGWNYYSGKTNFSLNSSYRYGDSGYGLNGSYSTTQYIITPELQVGSAFKFRVCRGAASQYTTASAKLYKAIKIGTSYYIDENVVYSNISLPNGTSTTMDQLQSCEITEGGYVAIQLYYAAIDDITYQASSTVSAITDNNGYTTFASSNLLDLTTANLPSDLEAYKAKIDGVTVKFTEINQTVPANTGMLLKGNPNTEYKIAIAESSATVENNDFLVNSTGYTFAAESGYTYYGLKKNSDPLVFATFAPASVAIPTNKAYLKVANTSARELTCTFDDVTGISTVNHDAKADGQYFNLAGQRVAQPVKGLYIVNGRKVVMK